MEDFWEILKYTLPSLILFVTVFYLLRQHLQGLLEMKATTIQDQRKQQSLPLRIQAYERLMLLCERIQVDQLVYRLREPAMTVKALQAALIMGVQQEFEHNLSQQIYTSGNLWQIIELAKNEVLAHIIETAAAFDPEENAMKFSNALISGKGKAHQVLEKAKEALRSEVKLLF